MVLNDGAMLSSYLDSTSSVKLFAQTTAVFHRRVCATDIFVGWEINSQTSFSLTTVKFPITAFVSIVAAAEGNIRDSRFILD